MWLLSGPCCLIPCCAWKWVAALALYSGLWLFDRWRAAWSHSCLDWVPAQFPYLHVILSISSSVSGDLPLTSQSMNAGEKNQTPTRCGTSITSPLAVTSIHEIKLNSRSLSSESYNTRDAQRICRNIINWGLWGRWSRWVCVGCKAVEERRCRSMTLNEWITSNFLVPPCLLFVVHPPTLTWFAICGVIGAIKQLNINETFWLYHIVSNSLRCWLAPSWTVRTSQFSVERVLLLLLLMLSYGGF